MSNLPAQNLKYRGQDIKRVKQYKYLGKIIESNLGHEKHLEEQLLKAQKTNIQLVPFMLRGNGISPSMSRNLIVGAMQAQTEYGLKNTTFTNFQ